MNKLSILSTSMIVLFNLYGCDSKKDMTVTSANSAQKAAEEYSKSFQNTMAENNQKDSSKVSENSKGKSSSMKTNASKQKGTSSAGIAGLPKNTVENVESMIDKTKEMAKNAADTIESTGKELVSSGSSSSKDTTENNAESTKQSNNQHENMSKNEASQPNAKPEMSQDSVQDVVSSEASEAPNATNNQSGKENTNSKTNTDKPQQSSTENAGIAGLPKEAVEGATALVDETKEMASNASEKVANAGKALANSIDSSAPEKGNASDTSRKGTHCGSNNEAGAKQGAQDGSKRTVDQSCTSTQQSTKSPTSPEMADDQSGKNYQSSLSNNSSGQQ
jgi:hypothetical protein